MIDLHCHILPAIDDGATDRATALQMARMALADGIQATACTPHIYPGLYDNRADGIRTAIEQLRRHPEIGIILMDIKMEEMNGLEATQYIRSFNQEVVIIMQTGFVQDATREEAFAAGCDGFLEKPVDQQVLRE